MRQLPPITDEQFWLLQTALLSAASLSRQNGHNKQADEYHELHNLFDDITCQIKVVGEIREMIESAKNES